MEDCEVDVEASADAKVLKQPARVKKTKKFFDDSSPTRPIVKEGMKIVCKEKVQKNPANEAIGAKAGSTKEHQEPVDDEAAWLEALERGELDDNGEIPKTRDLSLMTARQRALLDRTSSTLVEEINPQTTAAVVETEDERRKRIEKNKRRKLQAVKKAKETQKQTIRRLVEIPSSKDKLKQSSSSNTKSTTPMIKSVCNAQSSTISYPEGFGYPLSKQPAPPPLPPARSCVVCGKQRKYSCSKTRAPLCSLQCYRANLATGQVLAVT